MKNKVKEPSFQDIKLLVKNVFQLDKTEHYDYHGKGREDRCGRVPKGVGTRFKTPKEIAIDFSREYNFEDELFKGDKQ